MHDTPVGNGEYRANWPTDGRDAPAYIHLAIGPDLGQACNMPSPHFFFNSTTPRPEDADAVDSLAKCLNRPDVRNAPIRLIGHADPRGGAQYNEKLAEARAQDIAKQLEAHGVAAQRITTISEGALGDGPNDKPYSYGYDRRVDIMVDTFQRPEGPGNEPSRDVAPADVRVQQPQLPAVQDSREKVTAPPPAGSAVPPPAGSAAPAK